MPPKPPARRFLSGLTCFGSSAMVSLRQSTWRLPAVLVLLRCPSYTTGSADLSPTLGRAGPWAGRKEGPVGPAWLPPEVYFRPQPPLSGRGFLNAVWEGLGSVCHGLTPLRSLLGLFTPLVLCGPMYLCTPQRSHTPFHGPASHSFKVLNNSRSTALRSLSLKV